MGDFFVSKHAERHSADGLTASKRTVLLQLALSWQRARQAYIEEYWDPRYLRDVLRAPRRLRESRRRLGWAPVEMSVAHHQTAFLSAMDALKRVWSSRLSLVAREISAFSGTRQDEKRWAHWVLRHPDLLQQCLDGEVPLVPLDLSLDQPRAARRLRRLVIRRRGSPPRPARRPWFEVDAALYRTFTRPEDRFFRGSWIAFGVGRGRRLCVPLAGARPLFEGLGPEERGSNLRIYVDERVAVHFRIRIPRPHPMGSTEIGIDKGYRTLLTVSTGDPAMAREYGAGASESIGRIAQSEALRARQRRRIAAHARSLRDTDRAKARRMQKNNLGHQAITRRTSRGRAFLRGEIGRAVNALFASERPRRIHVERLDLRSSGLARGLRQRLGRWAWGHLQRRLAYKAELNGVELNVVNAAYTSQMCPTCGFASKPNRQGGTFRCRSCGYVGSADAVAATNVLARGSDTAITRFMPVSVVKHILDDRWRSARSGRAWGSNCAEAADATVRRTTSTREPRTTVSGQSINGLQTLDPLVTELQDVVPKAWSTAAGGDLPEVIQDSSSGPDDLVAVAGGRPPSRRSGPSQARVRASARPRRR